MTVPEKLEALEDSIRAAMTITRELKLTGLYSKLERILYEAPSDETELREELERR